MQQIGDMSTVPILFVRQTVDMIGKPLEINISSTCIKPGNGNVERVDVILANRHNIDVNSHPPME